MKRLAAVTAVLLLTQGVARAQVYVPQFSRPTLPPAAALDRLNLRMAWYAYLPVDGKRDGPLSLEVRGNQVIVQLASGLVVALDASTGYTQWRTQVGVPYRTEFAPGINAQGVFPVNGPRLYGLDRATGRVQWEFDLPTAPTAQPVADDQRVYLCLGNGDMSIYRLQGPGQKQLDRDTDNGKNLNTMFSRNDSSRGQVHVITNLGKIRETIGGQPIFQNAHKSEILLDYPVILSPNLVTFGGNGGKFFSTTRAFPGPLYRFPVDHMLAAAPGFHSDAMYLPGRDSTLYAVHLESGRTLWTFRGTGEPFVRKPEVTDDDVYVVRANLGMHRLDRRTGQLVWQTPEASRFLGANPKFVYAADRHGRLLVLDRQRGGVLANLDTRLFLAPIANEMTDRVFLAANDGLVICLHDRQYAVPLKTKSLDEPPTDEKKPPMDAPPEMKAAG